MQETWVWSLGQEDPSEEGMATDFVVTALLKFAILSTSYTTGWTHSKSLPVGEKWIYILQILAFKITVICVVLFCSKQNKHGARSKEPACQFRRCERHRFNPWVRKIPWRRKWQPTPVFMPEESHGQRSLAGYSLGLQRWALTNLSPISLRKSVKVKVLVAQSCPTLWDPMDCSPPDSSVHWILQARIQEWLAISFSRGSSQPRDWTQVSHITGRFFTVWATRPCPPKWLHSEPQPH